MTSLPEHGRTKDELLAAIHEFQAADADWRRGRLFSQVYFVSDEHEEALLAAYASSFSLNGLSARTFPSLARMEQEVIQMTAHLLGLSSAFGSITSGGSESNFLALKAARDRARVDRPEVTSPEIVVPMTAHPTINKAAHYLGLTEIRVEVTPEQEADPAKMQDRITDNTILLVASAPSWPHGAIDPVEEIAAMAVEHNLALHVDACVGGFFLPFAKQLGRGIRNFDLSVDGVSSISADLHKFGYAAKGSSLILHREASGFEAQVFDFTGWTGGRYTVPTAAGSRPGGSIAAAWFAMNYLGASGYLDLTRRCLETTSQFTEGIRLIPSLFVFGDPQTNLFAFGSTSGRVAEISEGMKARGWFLGLQGRPPSSLHVTITPAHKEAVADFLADLAAVAAEVNRAPAVTGPAVEAKYN